MLTVTVIGLFSGSVILAVMLMEVPNPTMSGLCDVLMKCGGWLRVYLQKMECPALETGKSPLMV